MMDEMTNEPGVRADMYTLRESLRWGWKLFSGLLPRAASGEGTGSSTPGLSRASASQVGREQQAASAGIPHLRVRGPRVGKSAPAPPSPPRPPHPRRDSLRRDAQSPLALPRGAGGGVAPALFGQRGAGAQGRGHSPYTPERKSKTNADLHRGDAFVLQRRAITTADGGSEEEMEEEEEPGPDAAATEPPAAPCALRGGGRGRGGAAAAAAAAARAPSLGPSLSSAPAPTPGGARALRGAALPGTAGGRARPGARRGGGGSATPASHRTG
ncbi:unnamed protein product [Nyctereutes procyonoides]|uniref:(raccoon dog) hypothetical protein n=1 Tax=Nyctereutes procyonoides TaxID=34880 RepID=A0A811ZXV1_NYCPR|nr:unnamed protein product [Nyctereutes procyonoides]